ncbi:hypothetical protein SAMD00023519_00174 [Listeria monocytogenes]|nr:hypothetical protein SAMD00023519_00174 [Listeria monocytogenes]
MFFRFWQIINHTLHIERFRDIDWYHISRLIPVIKTTNQIHFTNNLC